MGYLTERTERFELPSHIHPIQRIDTSNELHRIALWFLARGLLAVAVDLDQSARDRKRYGTSGASAMGLRAWNHHTSHR